MSPCGLPQDVGEREWPLPSERAERLAVTFDAGPSTTIWNDSNSFCAAAMQISAETPGGQDHALLGMLLVPLQIFSIASVGRTVWPVARDDKTKQAAKGTARLMGTPGVRDVTVARPLAER